MTHFVEKGNQDTHLQERIEIVQMKRQDHGRKTKKNPSSTARTFADLLSCAMYSEPVVRETFQSKTPYQQAISATHLEQQREQRGGIVARNRVERDRVEHASRWAFQHSADPAME